MRSSDPLPGPSLPGNPGHGCAANPWRNGKLYAGLRFGLANAFVSVFPGTILTT
jgi:hypothetical protein